MNNLESVNWLTTLVRRESQMVQLQVMERIMELKSNEFSFEGTAFSAYETQVEGSIPVYRFFEPTIGVHFYTPNEEERKFVEDNLNNYDFEGIAYYAFPLEI